MKKINLVLSVLSAFALPAFAAPIDALKHQFDNTRVFHSDEEVVYGYATEKGEKNGAYFSFFYATNELEFGGKKMVLIGDKFEEAKVNADGKFNEKVLDYLSQRYGIKYANGANGTAYVFLDYSCPFSRQFVQSGQLKKLSRQGKNIWIMPISRLGTVEGISNYSALTCMTQNNEKKLERFMSWMDKGEVTISQSELSQSKCYYWLDLKPYYGIIEKLKLNGVPSVVEVN